MNLSEAVLKKIIEACEGAPDAIARELGEVFKIDAVLKALAGKERKLDQNYQVDKKNFAKQRADIQETCKHWDKTCHGDPSGGSDRFTKCNICGKDDL